MGRPREYDRAALARKFQRYVAATEMPVVAQFAYENAVPRELLYDWEEFSTLLKLSAAKKEAFLEINGLAGKLNTAMAIFSLKQMGWKDRVEHSGDKNAPVALTIQESKL